MAFIGASSSSSSFSSVTYKWAHDVFLSFRGEDTRDNFTAHLHAALHQSGINTYIDNDLERGENISPALLKAIKESRISVIVFSQNYASSSWCLDELATILECKGRNGQIVLPVFYKIDPLEVRHQRNRFGEALVKHEERFKDDQTKVQRWKTVLKEVANLSGWDLKNYKNEHDFIQEIIERVNSILVKETYFQISKYPVGIESRVQVVKWLLDIKKKDSTCMVGIVGMGGIGKTTLAKAIYNSIASQFEDSCFLENVRETYGQKGLIHLQNKLLSKILGGSSQMVDIVDQGVTLIEKRFHQKKILLVLDDVDKLDQLEMLSGRIDWFGLGSRIIITTRDKHLLRAHGVKSIYPMEGLDHDEALRLFSWHAFKSDKPNSDYVEVIEDALRYCGGLPLALIVLGSTLKCREILYWKDKLDEYKRNPNSDIQKILKISFDGLEVNAKKIFLDIACFFKGEDAKYVRNILDACGFKSKTGIEELKDKCLITEESWGSFMMHDLLQEMGRDIVRQESEEPGERSRLWFHEDVRYVLEGNTGTNKVEGILINLPDRDHIVHLSPETFKKMKRLRLFINHNAHFSEELNIHSNELRVIDCAEYPGESFPSNFRGKNLVILRMAHSRIKILEGVQHFQKLTHMDFYKCKFIEKIPDVSRIPNLEKLKLVGCKNLVEVHESVGFLDKLVELNTMLCDNLQSFPKKFVLRSLKYLNICGCSMVKNFPEIEYPMEYLEDVNCCDTGIEELPSSVCNLVGLKKLRLGNSQNPTDLLIQMFDLKEPLSFIRSLLMIGELNLNYCLNLTNFSDSNFLRALGCSSTLYSINLSGSGIVTLPRCVESFVGLKFLNLNGCKQLREILGLPPNVETVSAHGCVSLEIFLEGSRRSQLFNTEDPPELVGFGIEIPAQQTLRELDLSGSAIVSLPTWFSRFVRLKRLRLKNCKQLREILGLPPNVKKLSSRNCWSLEVFLGEARRCQFNTCVPPDPLRVGTVVSSAVQPLEQKFQLECSFNRLERLNLSDSAIISLPTLFNSFVRLKGLELERCKQLREVPELPLNIEYVHLGGCISLERFPFNNIYDLPKLSMIDFSDCPEQIGNAVHNHLFSEGHPKVVRYFEFIYPEYFKEFLGQIDTGPLHLHSENTTTFAFFAVFGTRRDDGQYKRLLLISVDVFNNGEKIHSHTSGVRNESARSHRVYTSPNHSQLNNLRVIFRFFDNVALMSFKNCGIHIKAKRNRVKIHFDFSVKRNQLYVRCRDDDDDDDDDDESNW